MAGSNVGELTIALSFDKKGINTSLKSVGSQLQAGGKSSGGLFGNAFSVAAGNLISSAVRKVTSMVTGSLDTAIKRVDTLKNADKVFTAMGYATESVSDSMATLNSYLDGLPTSMTTAVQGVQSLSASFGGIEKGTQTFIDMNNAGLAFGATAEQVENAIMQLGQLSLDGPLDAQTWNSLRNSGFSPVFAAMAKEAGITVGELKEQFGGNGTKTVGDFLDALHRLGTEGGAGMESLSDLARKNTEGIGTALENVKNRIGKAIAKIIDHIGSEKIAGAINTISSNFTKVADVIIGIIDFIRNNQWVMDILISSLGAFMALGIANKIMGIAKAMKMALDPKALALAAIIFVIVQIITHFDEIKATVENVMKAIGEFFDGVGNWFAELGQNIANFFITIWQNITDFFNGVGQFLAGIIQGIWQTVFQPIVDFVSNVVVLIVAILANIAQWVWENVLAPIVGFVSGVATTIAEAVANWWQGVMDTIGGIAAWVNQTIIQPVVNFFNGLFQKIGEIFTNIVNKIKAVFGVVAAWVNNHVISPIKRFFEGLANGIRNVFEGIRTTVKNVIGTIAGIVKAPINGIIGAINGVINTINSITVPDWVPGLGGQHANFPTIPMLASGGITTRATTAMIGEAGREAVLPLDRNTGWASILAEKLMDEMDEGAGREIVVNMTNNIDSKLDAQEIGQIMMTSIRRASA